jgi:UDP-hydrolysing UDP-N-acetyl-D-glucosamine 2-epimerase
VIPYLIVGGSHISSEFGLTIGSIKYPISAVIETLLSSDTVLAMAKSIGMGCISAPDHLYRINPDWLVVLGDRFETLSIALAAYCLRIPIAHISGGETTQGSLDNGFRNCISQLASQHFVYCEEYKTNLLWSNEPDTVHNVGCLTMEGLEKYWSHKKEDYYIVSWHPETANDYSRQKSDLLTLVNFLSKRNKKFVFCSSKGDPGSRLINENLKNHIVDFTREEFLTRLGKAKAIIGNSSAGIYEAPILSTPTINIGNRQTGRLKAPSIIDCKCTPEGLANAFRKLESKEFQQSLKNIEIPYRAGSVSKRILGILKNA